MWKETHERLTASIQSSIYETETKKFWPSAANRIYDSFKLICNHLFPRKLIQMNYEIWFRRVNHRWLYIWFDGGDWWWSWTTNVIHVTMRNKSNAVPTENGWTMMKVKVYFSRATSHRMASDSTNIGQRSGHWQCDQRKIGYSVFSSSCVSCLEGVHCSLFAIGQQTKQASR